MKCCISCKASYELTKFYKDKSKKDGHSGECKSCCSIRRKKSYYAKHDHELAGAARRRADNPDRVKFHNRNRKLDPLKKAKDKESDKKWRENNRQRLLAIQRKSYIKVKNTNPDRYREILDAKSARHRHKRESDLEFKRKLKITIQKRRKIKRIETNEYNRWRHYNKRRVGGTFTREEWRLLKSLCNWQCVCCSKVSPLTIDHIKPTSLGGLNVIANIQPLCRSCNSKKFTKIIDYRPQHVKDRFGILN